MTDRRYHAGFHADRGPTLSDVARKEFWIVAESYSALIHGFVTVWGQVLRTGRRIDERTLAQARERMATPAK